MRPLNVSSGGRRDSRRHKPAVDSILGGGNLVSLLSALALVLCLAVFTVITYHLQMDVEGEARSGARAFVFSNSIRKIPENIEKIESYLHLSGLKSSINDPKDISNGTSSSQKVEESSHGKGIDEKTEEEEDREEEERLKKEEEEERDKSKVGVEVPSPTSPKEGKNMDPRFAGHKLSCPNADLVSYWRLPQVGDVLFRSPFADTGPKDKYVTFEPDVGGWNNIRMQMETVLVFAAATGRTLVLPPDQPMYLLNKGKGHQNAHHFGDYFPFDWIRTRLPVLEMNEFLAKEGITGGLTNNASEVLYPPHNKSEFSGEDKTERNLMWDYLRIVGTCPTWDGWKEFVVIPPGPGIDVTTFPNAADYIRRRDIMRDVPKSSRNPVFYDDYWQQQKVIHFISKPGEGYRLLQHFYTFLHFDDEKMDLNYKRFVRDYVHYIDLIFCKAAIIVNHLLNEGKGRYSAFHTRRGELQYNEVKIPSAQILKNVGQFIPPGELIFIATDERNRSFFDSFKSKWPKLRFLDDYRKIADLTNVNPNFLGMIDQVVCTRGRVFIGTWFSTFTGYITRMRGYLGHSDRTIWFGDKNHRDRFQHDELPMFPFYMREWNVSWWQID